MARKILDVKILNDDAQTEALNKLFEQNIFVCKYYTNYFSKVYKVLLEQTDFVEKFDLYMKTYGSSRHQIRLEIVEIIDEIVDLTQIKSDFIKKFGAGELLTDYAKKPNLVYELFKEGIFKSGKIDVFLDRLDKRSLNISLKGKYVQTDTELLFNRFDYNTNQLYLFDNHYISLDDVIIKKFNRLFAKNEIENLYLKKNDNLFTIDIVFSNKDERRKNFY